MWPVSQFFQIGNRWSIKFYSWRCCPSQLRHCYIDWYCLQVFLCVLGDGLVLFKNSVVSNQVISSLTLQDIFKPMSEFFIIWTIDVPLRQHLEGQVIKDLSVSMSVGDEPLHQLFFFVFSEERFEIFQQYLYDFDLFVGRLLLGIGRDVLIWLNISFDHIASRAARSQGWKCHSLRNSWRTTHIFVVFRRRWASCLASSSSIETYIYKSRANNLTLYFFRWQLY